MLHKVTLVDGSTHLTCTPDQWECVVKKEVVEIIEVRELQGNPYLKAFNKLPKRAGLFNPGKVEDIIARAYARDQWTKQYAWAVPSMEAIRAIGQYLNEGIYEIGAGSGYWARMITRKWDDPRYIAYDNWSSHAFTHRYYNVQDTPLDSCTNLFTCWPSYEGEWAARALKDYRPQRVIYIGEGHGGCTADDEFHEILERDFEEKQSLHIPQYEGLHDRLEIWERK